MNNERRDHGGDLGSWKAPETGAHTFEKTIADARLFLEKSEKEIRPDPRTPGEQALDEAFAEIYAQQDLQHTSPKATETAEDEMLIEVPNFDEELPGQRNSGFVGAELPGVRAQDIAKHAEYPPAQTQDSQESSPLEQAFKQELFGQINRVLEAKNTLRDIQTQMETASPQMQRSLVNARREKQQQIRKEILGFLHKAVAADQDPWQMERLARQWAVELQINLPEDEVQSALSVGELREVTSQEEVLRQLDGVAEKNTQRIGEFVPEIKAIWEQAPAEQRPFVENVLALQIGEWVRNQAELHASTWYQPSEEIGPMLKEELLRDAAVYTSGEFGALVRDAIDGGLARLSTPATRGDKQRAWQGNRTYQTVAERLQNIHNLRQTEQAAPQTTVTPEKPSSKKGDGIEQRLERIRLLSRKEEERAQIEEKREAIRGWMAIATEAERKKLEEELGELAEQEWRLDHPDQIKTDTPPAKETPPSDKKRQIDLAAAVEKKKADQQKEGEPTAQIRVRRTPQQENRTPLPTQYQGTDRRNVEGLLVLQEAAKKDPAIAAAITLDLQKPYEQLVQEAVAERPWWQKAGDFLRGIPPETRAKQALDDQITQLRAALTISSAKKRGRPPSVASAARARVNEETKRQKVVGGI